MIGALENAERDLVAGLILAPELIPDTVGKIEPDELMNKDLAELLRRLFAASGAGTAISGATIGGEAGPLRELYAGLVYAAKEILSPEAARELAAKLRARARRRRVLGAIETAARGIVEADDSDLDSTLDSGLAHVVATADGAKSQTAHPGGEVLANAMRRAADPTSRTANVTPTGLADLDWLLGGGMRPGRVLIVGARPGVGKSALALCIARNIAKNGGTTAFASLEMSPDELGDRLIALESQTDLRALQAGEVSPDQLRRIGDAYAKAKAWEDRILILDGVQTVAGMAASLRRLEVKRTPARLLVVDYLQLCRGTKKQDRRLEVGEVSTDLKRLARTRNVGVIALSQLARKTDERNDGPSLSDLYESGQIEADADAVLMLWRDKTPGVLNGRLAKNRSGPTGRTDFAWMPATCDVRNLARRPEGATS